MQGASGSSGLEDLMGDDTRVPTSAPIAQSGGNAMEDLMGMFGSDTAVPSVPPGADGDLMNGFGGLDLNGSGSQAQSADSRRTNQDILGLF
jgi:hypothetical protein